MCLDKRYTRKEIEKWLQDKPQKFIVYKAANRKIGKHYPPNFERSKPYEKINEIKGKRNPIRIYYYHSGARAFYRPYFHLFEEKGAAEYWHNVIHHSDGDIPVVLKCEVNKKDVHVIGKQDCLSVVVVTKFKIMEEVK